MACPLHAQAQKADGPIVIHVAKRDPAGITLAHDIGLARFPLGVERIEFLLEALVGRGLACGSLVAAWYLGYLPQSDRLAVITALHRAFVTLGGLTIVSSLSFWMLRARDRESVSRAAPDLA
jgi:hypothetical protein